MPIPNERAHTNRRRAESFGQHAAQYDRSRPGYPDELIDELVRPGPTDALDVGCGTGKASAALAGRGVRVLGVDLDTRMAEVARARGVPVEIAHFETWDPTGRCFDLVLSGQAWHWIDPHAGARKVAAVLRPSGRVALFWNLGSFAPPVRHAMDRVYEQVAPEINDSVLRGGGRAIAPYLEQLRAAGLRRHHQRCYRWQQRYTREQWLELIGTHSDHVTLPSETFQRLHDRVAAVVDDLGGVITVDYETQVLFASR